MDFVWPYHAAEAKGSEIELSIASVRKFFQGNANIIVIGDNPEGVACKHIAVSRVQGKGHRAFRDTFHRLQHAAANARIGPEFVWMMDDVFFTQPVTIEELRIPRHQGSKTKDQLESWQPSNEWLKLKKKTMLALVDRGVEIVYDFATHLPHVVTQENIKNLTADWDMPNNMFLWEIIYGNQFKVELPESFLPFLRRWKGPQEQESVRTMATQAKVVNCNSSGWDHNADAVIREIATGKPAWQTMAEAGREKILFAMRINRNRFTKSLAKHLTQKGYWVEEVSGSISASHGCCAVIIWNGERPRDKRLAKQCQDAGIACYFLENGHFPQRRTFCLSRCGSVGGALFSGEEVPEITAEEDESLSRFFHTYSGGKKYRPKNQITGILQLERDYAIRNHSPMKRMQEFVDYVEALYPVDYVVFKSHPKNKDIPLRTREPIIRGGSIWDCLLKSKLCVGLNSTVLYEAILAGVPTLSIGSSPLSRHPNKHREIVHELLARQIPIDLSGDIDQRIERSIGVAF